MTHVEQLPALECKSVGIINLAPFSDGRIYELVRGEDFPDDFPLELLRALLRYAAKHGKLQITTTKTVDGLAIQVLPLAHRAKLSPYGRPSGAAVLPMPEYGPDDIAHLDLSVRTYNMLRRRGIETITQLAEKTEEELRGMTNFGVRSMYEVTEALATRGLTLTSES